MAARRLTPAQARERKTRLTAICLAVVFVIIAAIQGPTLLKALHKPSPGTTAAATSPASTPTAGAAPPAPGATVAPGAAPAPSLTTGQLTNFSRFPLEDPFHSQVAVAAADGTTATTTTTPRVVATPASKPTPKPTPKAKPTPALPTTAAPTIPFTITPKLVTPPNAALITLNGKRQIVLVGAGFPIVQPLFKLVALGKKDVKIGVLGGSFTSGAPTLALLRGRAITLADEADGLRYVLQLVRLTTSTPPAAPAVTTTTPAAPSSGG